jgi:hypothetical protein
MYADDIILLFKSSKGLQEKLDIHVLNTYCKDGCLTVNTSKTKILIFNKAGRLIKHSFRYGNENIECVLNCKYLGIWFSSSGSYSYAQNELYKKSLKAFSKLKKDLLSLNPNIRTSMHVFDHTIKPILLYGSDIWGMFNPFTMKCKKETPSFDNIYSGSLCEKIHLKFCQFILDVHKRTTNIVVLSELGRFPLYFNIIKCMLLYWYRLENLGKEFPLSKEAYNETKLLYLSTKPTWYESINIIVNILKTTNTDINLLLLRKKHLENSKIMLTFFLNHYLSQNGKKQINQLSDSKLKTYNICKNNFGLEKYLIIVNNFELRRSFTKLRTSSHRYQGVPRHNRVCTKCSSIVIEDELHFLFECSKYDEDRESMLFEITTACSNFRNMKSKQTDLAF